MRIAFSSFMVIVGVCLVAGCGGSTRSDSKGNQQSVAAQAGATTSGTRSEVGSGLRLTKTELIKRADLICKRFKAQLLTAKYTVRNQQDFVSVAPQRAALERSVVAKLGRLVPPSALESDWRRLLEYRTTVAEELVKLGEDARLGSDKGMRAVLASSASVEDQLARVAKRDGFKNCAQLS